MDQIRFEAYSSSNTIGTSHEENQDSYLIDNNNLLFGLADGVGGYRGAKIASSLAMEILGNSAKDIVDEASLKKRILEINEQIISKASELGFLNMGTTIAVAKVIGSGLILANVGDSPMLLLHDKKLEPVYYDDSYRHSDPMQMSGIIQYVGLRGIEVHTNTIQYTKGDTMLICSDGITDNLFKSPVNDRLETLMQTGSARKIVEVAIEEKIKPDDMTAIILLF